MTNNKQPTPIQWPDLKEWEATQRRLDRIETHVKSLMRKQHQRDLVEEE